MGLLDGYFTPDTIYGAIQGDYNELLKGKVNRPAPDHTVMDIADTVVNGVNSGYVDSSKFDKVKLAHLLKSINPVFNTKGLDPVKLLQATLMVAEDKKRLPLPEHTQNDTTQIFQADAGFHNYSEESEGQNQTRDSFDEQFDPNSERVNKIYRSIISPYVDSNGPKPEVKDTLTAVQQVSQTLNVDIGRGSLGAFEPGSNHQWRIQLYPYERNGVDISLDASAEVEGSGRLNEGANQYNIVPPLPWYPISIEKDPSKSDLPLGVPSIFHFGYHCPAIQYSLSLGNTQSKSIPLFNNSNFQVPNGTAYSPTLTMSVLDDVYGSFRNWYHKYLNNLYDLKSGSIPRFDTAALLVRLIIFKPNFQPKYEFRFICVPDTYSIEFQGTNDSDEELVQLNLSIVGMLKMRNTYAPGQWAPGGNYDTERSKMTWTDITMSPLVDKAETK